VSGSLPGVLAYLAPALSHYGYLAVGGLLVVEDFGVPVPGETVMIAAAVYAGAGRLSIVAVGVIAAVPAITGDNIGYAIGRYGAYELAAVALVLAAAGTRLLARRLPTWHPPA
jgi:membrane protein DedA with SNARE-associated domain